jgi:hypothetical protein
MPINKGGRGKKADYESKVIRVPLPIIGEVENLIENFHNDLSSNTLAVSTDSISLESAIEIATNILKSKKSAKESVRKLLQVLYQVDKIEL